MSAEPHDGSPSTLLTPLITSSFFLSLERAVGEGQCHCSQGWSLERSNLSVRTGFNTI